MNNLEDLYPLIGQEVANLLETGWDTVKVEVEYAPDVLTLRGHYITGSGSKEQSFKPSHNLVELFRDLHDRMVNEMKDDWKRAVFTMSHTGKFSINFEYS